MQAFPEKLLRGYRDFRQDRYRAHRARYAELAQTGQKPGSLVIACCDSRVAPETIFNCGPGELFVVRNVANLVPPYTVDGVFDATSAALEYAVQSLRVKHVIVMGHGRCGGIQSVLDSHPEPLSPDDFVGKWMGLVSSLTGQIEHLASRMQTDPQTALERISIRHSIANLRTFPCVKKRLEQGEMHLHGVWFDISCGELWVMDQKSGDFERTSIGRLSD